MYEITVSKDESAGINSAIVILGYCIEDTNSDILKADYKFVQELLGRVQRKIKKSKEV